jgi:hypothetical protein
MTPSDTELARELRAIRPEIDSDFAAELDAWVAEGFPSAAELARRGARTERAPRLAGLRERFRLRPLMPAMAAVASILLVAVVTVGVLQSRDDVGVVDSRDDIQQDSLNSGGQSPKLESTDDSGATGRTANGTPVPGGAQACEGCESALPTTVPPVPPTTEPVKPGEERIQEKTASMTLSADVDEVREVADGVVDVVERYDGIVVSSQVNVNGDRARASFDLRISSQNLEAALSDLSDLASVQARSDGVTDITAPFVSAEERFDDAKAEVDALVAQLAEAESADEIAQIRGQLQIARGELAAVRAELAGLKQRAQFAKLSLTVVGDGDADGWSIGDAIDDAGSVLESIGGALLVGLAAIVPFALLLGLGWLGYSGLRRRRREKALDES